MAEYPARCSGSGKLAKLPPPGGGRATCPDCRSAGMEVHRQEDGTLLVGEHGWADDTGMDWRGTWLRPGALAVWVVTGGRAVEGEVISWDREFVTVRPLRQSCVVVGGVPKAEERDQRPMTIDRRKVTILRPLGPGQVVGDGGA